MVYDLTVLVLNDALCAPTFWMPSVDNFSDVDINFSWFVDIDAVEIFHNYNMLEIL